MGGVVGLRKKAKRRSRRRLSFSALAWAAILTAAGAAAAAYPTGRIVGTSELASARFALCSNGAQQTCVVDGDTIRYRGERIRLSDIDAPEIREAKCRSERERGEAAKRRLHQWVNQGPFHIVRTGWRDQDRYGRKLRELRRDGRSFGDLVVAEGLARRWDGARRSWCA